jgi:GNAT superfamily N-acetyltransferase
MLDGWSSTSALVRRVTAELRSHGVAEVFWTIGPGHRPENVDRVLLDHGARVHHAIDICAISLDQDLPDQPPAPQVTTLPVRTRKDVSRFAQVNSVAWGYPQPSEDEIDRAFTELARGSFVGYWQGTPAGAGGYTLAGEVARLWGAAVVPAFRGRGVYRALVRARLAEAMSRGATLALVHADRRTSSPILQRLGFEVYGQQKVLAFSFAGIQPGHV